MNKKILFRLLSGVLCLLTLPFGAIVIFDRISRGPLEFDSTLKAGIAAFAWGIVMLVMVIRGR